EDRQRGAPEQTRARGRPHRSDPRGHRDSPPITRSANSNAPSGPRLGASVQLRMAGERQRRKDGLYRGDDSMIQSPARRTRSRRLLAHGNPRLEEEIHDPYRTPRKAKSPARCSDCGATYRKGRWTWERLMPPARASCVCPACRRVRDRDPAGEITLGGRFFVEHADEALRLVRNVEGAQHGGHSLPTTHT